MVSREIESDFLPTVCDLRCVALVDRRIISREVHCLPTVEMFANETPVSFKREGECVIDRQGYKMPSSVIHVLVIECLSGYFEQPQPTSIRSIQPSSIDSGLPIISHFPFLYKLQIQDFTLPPQASMASQSPYIHVTSKIENQPSPEQNKRKRLVYYPSQAKPNQKTNTTVANCNLSSNQAPTKPQLQNSAATQYRYRSVGTGLSVFALCCARLNILTTNLDVYGCT